MEAATKVVPMTVRNGRGFPTPMIEKRNETMPTQGAMHSCVMTWMNRVRRLAAVHPISVYIK
jgi:hypothetical protein